MFGQGLHDYSIFIIITIGLQTTPVSPTFKRNFVWVQSKYHCPYIAVTHISLKFCFTMLTNYRSLCGFHGDALGCSVSFLVEMKEIHNFVWEMHWDLPRQFLCGDYPCTYMEICLGQIYIGV